MRSGNRSPHALVQLALTLLASVATPTHAGELNDLKVPAPITSAQHEKTLKEAGLPAAERAALDAAFDAYVDEWQRLRDRTLRPLAAELEQMNAQMVKESMATARSARETALPERSPEQAQAEMDAFRHQQEVAAAKRLAQAVLAVPAEEVQRRAAAWTELDVYLRGDGNRRNPGTTADMIAAAIWIVLWSEGRSRVDSATESGACDESL